MTSTTTLSPSSSPEPLWTIQQAAAYVGVSERYLRDSDCPRLRLPGRGPKGQVLIRFMPSVLRAWLEQWRTDGPSSDSAEGL